MAITPRPRVYTEKEYPSRDNKPIGETPLHRDVLADTIALLTRALRRPIPSLYISGNMLSTTSRGTAASTSPPTCSRPGGSATPIAAATSSGRKARGRTW